MRRCAICGEREDPRYPNAGDGWAEMVDPDTMRGIEMGEITDPDQIETHIVHYQCGTSRDYTLA